MNQKDEDVELLREIICAFTRHHSDLYIEREKDSPDLIVMQAHRDDQPRIVGGAGRNIEALRNIFRVIAARNKKRITLLLSEPQIGQRGLQEPYIANNEWKPEKVIALLTKILGRMLSNEFKIELLSSKMKPTTMLEITAGRDDERVLEVAQPALQTIFHAIGRAEGRALYVEINRNAMAEVFGKR